MELEVRHLRALCAIADAGSQSGGELRDYLDHLKHARQKHVRLAGWVQRRNAALANARRSVRKAA